MLIPQWDLDRIFQFSVCSRSFSIKTQNLWGPIGALAGFYHIKHEYVKIIWYYLFRYLSGEQYLYAFYKGGWIGGQCGIDCELRDNWRWSKERAGGITSSNPRLDAWCDTFSWWSRACSLLNGLKREVGNSI